MPNPYASPVMTLEEEEYWCEQADLLHAREKVPDAEKARMRREWDALSRVAHEWVVA